MIKKSCCFTGHRPEKLPWGLNENGRECKKLKELLYRQAEQLITEFGITHFISGMARGIDTYAAEIVLQLKRAYPITLECAIPCEEQAVNWPENDRERYFEIVAQADHETMLQYHFTWDCYQRRNRYMVNQSDYVLAVWDGTKSGTSSTVHNARRKCRHIFIIDPVHLTITPNITVWK
jgi:uncharacterized phage-like protein YoqJ